MPAEITRPKETSPRLREALVFGAEARALLGKTDPGRLQVLRRWALNGTP
jgi:hypothetical protein